MHLILLLLDVIKYMGMEILSPPKKLKVIQSAKTPDSNIASLFCGINASFLEHGVGKRRCSILQEHIQKHGGVIHEKIFPFTTHLFLKQGLCKEKVLKFLNLKSFPKNLIILDVGWLSACLVQGKLVNQDMYLVFNDEKKSSAKKNLGILGEDKTFEGSKASSTSECCSDESFKNEVSSSSSNYQQTSILYGRRLISEQTNHNRHITDKLKVLQNVYENTQDRWRSLGYKKAIASIQSFHKPLETFEEVSSLPYVGKKLALKIFEIIETGNLRHLDYINPKNETINMFMKVWGAGPKTAEFWYSQGFRSLDDLREKAELTFQQKIGVQHYDDINVKIPRSEVDDIGAMIQEALLKLDPDAQMMVCGSHRRGRAMCGDIDILLTHVGEHSQGLLPALLNKLKETSLVTDDLIKLESRNQTKYMGLCKLPHIGSKYRRIDFLLAPYNEWSCCLLHFTGSALFNRNLRLVAKKKNMSLSQHALRKDVIRGKTGESKISEGITVPIFSEREIFQHLDLDYLEPFERDWI